MGKSVRTASPPFDGAPVSRRVLVVDPEARTREMIVGLLKGRGFDVISLDTSRDALSSAAPDGCELNIVAFDPADAGAFTLLERARDSGRTLSIALLEPGAESAMVQALKAGAFDCVKKPISSEEFCLHLERALATSRLLAENNRLRRQLEPGAKEARRLVGDSVEMVNLRNLIRTVAPSDANVLILGESGTGKELVARSIHELSGRAERPFIAVNCAAIPDELLESELFGHARGAFTGAVESRRGRFQLADGGTLFLDEIGDMNMSLQAKILRALEDQVITPVGDTRAIEVNVRIVAATHQNLELRVASGEFRKDLFYRLNVVPIEVPPLRRRREDIPMLIDFFVEKYCRPDGASRVGFTTAGLGCLYNYDWPGNVRELENLIERLAVIHPGKQVDVAELPEKFDRRRNSTPAYEIPSEIPEEGIDFNRLVDEFERALILKAVDKAHGVKNRAAKLLNIKRTTLVEKMKKKKMNIGRDGDGD